MRISTTMCSLALLGSILAAGLTFSSPVAADEGRDRDLGQNRAWLPMQGLIGKLDAAGYRNVEKIEREHGRYEVRAINRDGERVKLHLDAQTGELIGDGRDRRRAASREKDGSLTQAGQRHGLGAGDCNERRCRDDLPAKPGSVRPAGNR